MSVITKSLDELDEADLQDLVNGRIAEQRTIEYKAKLPSGNGDAEKREMAEDMSSFANASGGHIVYGIDAKNGIPIQVTGISGSDADAEQLRLRQVMNSWIAPKLPGVRFRRVDLASGNAAIVVFIPRSWSAPHAVTHPGHPGSLRFYTRDGNGKYPFDVGQLRNAFAGAETLTARIRAFRADRIAQIVSGETPVPLSSGPISILHLVPLDAFDRYANISLFGLQGGSAPFKPRSDTTVSNQRHNFDGFLVWEPSNTDTDPAEAYIQVFRTGVIEEVDANGLRVYDRSMNLPAITFEDERLWSLPHRLQLIKELGLDTPIIAMLTLIGVKGRTITRGQFPIPHRLDAIDRDVLALPDVLIETFDCDPAETLRTVFDVMWNAAGYGRSLGYDETGKRVPK